MAITPFKVEVPDNVLQDLKERLARTRWPDEIPGSGWDWQQSRLHQGISGLLAGQVRLAGPRKTDKFVLSF